MVSKRFNTKVAILAGGLGTRLSEETVKKPKALVEIGGMPILWHIMKYYSQFGFNEFVIALGYKGEYIKNWIEHKLGLKSTGRVLSSNKVALNHTRKGNPAGWIVDLVDTGQETLTGGRIKRLAPSLGKKTFMLTWCDAVADIDLMALLKFHRSHGRLATVTAVQPPPRFGHLVLEGDMVTQFREKNRGDEGWINGAFFVLEPEVLDYIEGDTTQWEKEPLERLAREGQLMAYRHKGFWQCMDTIYEKRKLEKLWQSGNAQWKIWKA
jgi:glucose-1-phosphate cytidylyltransferase